MLDTVSSPITKKVYSLGLNELPSKARRVGSAKATRHGVASGPRIPPGPDTASINVRLTYVRELADEASDDGLPAPELASGTSRVRGWRKSAFDSADQALLNAPNAATTKERRGVEAFIAKPAIDVSLYPLCIDFPDWMCRSVQARSASVCKYTRDVMDPLPIAGAIVAAPSVKDFLNAVLGESVKEVGALFGDFVRELRHKNLIAVSERARRRLADAGVSPNQVPLKIICPILEAASLEDDPDLQDLWANLLANAADSRQNVTVTSQYASILRELKLSDARFFQLYVEEYKKPRTGWHREDITAAAYECGLAKRRVGTVGQWMGYESKEAMNDGEKNIALAIDTLCRVGLMQKISQVDAIDSRQITGLIQQFAKRNTVGTLKLDTELTPGPTQLGFAFLEAVQPPLQS